MRVVLQRVSRASVEVDGALAGVIDRGILLLLGVDKADSQEDADYLLQKVIHLRIFPDANGKMNLSVIDIGGAILVVSQFTLYGDCTKGRRPSFDRAAPPDRAFGLYNYFLEQLSTYVPVQSGVFQADMNVSLLNDGPVTFLLDSRNLN